jgi:hypothetical protein
MITTEPMPGLEAHDRSYESIGEVARLRAIERAAKALSEAMTDCWGSEANERVDTWDAPADKVDALRAALAPSKDRGDG